MGDTRFSYNCVYTWKSIFKTFYIDASAERVLRNPLKSCVYTGFIACSENTIHTFLHESCRCRCQELSISLTILVLDTVPFLRVQGDDDSRVQQLDERGPVERSRLKQSLHSTPPR